VQNNRDITPNKQTHDSQEDNLSFLFGDKTVSKSILDDPFSVLTKNQVKNKENKRSKLNDAFLKTISSVEKQAQKNKYSYKVVGICVLSLTVGIIGIRTMSSFNKTNESNFRTVSSTMTKIVSQNINFKTEDIKSKIKANEIYTNDNYFINYNVKEDDTLSKVSKNFNTQIEILKIINNIKSDDELKNKENIVVPAIETTIHKVQTNETLGSIAESHKISVDDILAMNKKSIENKHMINIGQSIIIPTSEVPKSKIQVANVVNDNDVKTEKVEKIVKKAITETNKISRLKATKYDRTNSFVHTITAGETFEVLANRYSVSLAKILEANNIVDPTRIQIDQHVIIPCKKPNITRNVSRSRNIKLANRSLESSESVQTNGPSGRIVWPVPGGHVSSDYGWRGSHFHEGLDIVSSATGPIVSAMSGRVTFAGFQAGGYGNTVEIVSANGLKTRYAHCSSLNVYQGEFVSAGTHIANIGTTGFVTGPHLHFEVIASGTQRNPRTYF